MALSMAKRNIKIRKATPAMDALLRASGSNNPEIAIPAGQELAKALSTPLRQGVLVGDILADIFEVVPFARGVPTEFPLDFLSPGTEKEFTAYVIPKHGYIPQRNVEGDYVQIPTYEVGNAIDWNIRYAQDARWDIISRAMEVIEAGFVKKNNDDGWHTILSAGVDRNILVFDADATAGQFTKRLVSLMKVIMRRNGGGNSTSLNRGKLTDLYVSPEAIEDIRNWGVDQVDDLTRREIFTASDDSFTRLYDVNLHPLDELGEGQEYQDFYTNQLSGTLQAADVELSVGLDLSKDDAFIMPMRSPVEMFNDDNLHRERRQGVYGWGEHGFGVLDNRRVLLGSH